MVIDLPAMVTEACAEGLCGLPAKDSAAQVSSVAGIRDGFAHESSISGPVMAAHGAAPQRHRLKPVPPRRAGQTLSFHVRIQFGNGVDRGFGGRAVRLFVGVVVAFHFSDTSVLHYDAVAARQDVDVLVLHAVIYFGLRNQPRRFGLGRGQSIRPLPQGSRAVAVVALTITF